MGRFYLCMMRRVAAFRASILFLGSVNVCHHQAALRARQKRSFLARFVQVRLRSGSSPLYRMLSRSILLVQKNLPYAKGPDPTLTPDAADELRFYLAFQVIRNFSYRGSGNLLYDSQSRDHNNLR